MGKIVSYVYQHKEFIIGLLLTMSLFWPLAAAPFFTHHDDVHFIRLYEMNKCFQDGQIPCRWVPDLGGLYGYPIFNYYAPLPYYFGELVYLFSGSLLFAVKTMFAVSFLGAFIFMYLLVSKLFGKMGGLISALFYSFAPYHALDFYVRGAMGEMWALMLFPAVFWAILKLEEKPNLTHLLLLGVFSGFFLISHNLSVMIFLPVLLIWIILLFWKQRNLKFLWYTSFAFLIGLTLSAFYILPMIIEKNLVHVDSTTSGYFSYTEHFKGFKKLFLERTWGYGASVREVPGGERDGLSYQIGWLHLLGWLIAIISAKTLWRKNKWLSVVIISFSFLTLFAIFMVNPRSQAVWDAIEPLKYLQFPWRFLVLITFFIPFMLGSFSLLHFRGKNLLFGSLVLMVVVLNFSYFRPEKFIQTDDEKLLMGDNWERQIKRSIFDFLPIFAKEPPAELAERRYQILTGDSDVFDFTEGTNSISFKTDTRTHTIIRLSQYYFPDWKIYVDGVETKVEYKNNSLGLMTFILGKGNHEISARLYDTPIRSFANLLTLGGFVFSAVLFLSSFSRVRKWFRYYRERMS